MARFFVGLVLLFVLNDAASVPPYMDKPEPCCSPPYYTASVAIQSTYIYSNGLQVELQSLQTAYDSIEKKMGGKVNIGFSNGTEESYYYLYDYANKMSYDVYDVKEGLFCIKSPLTERFNKECIPEDSTYVSMASVGDRQLLVVSWYWTYYDSYYDEDVEYLQTVEAGECNPVFASINTFASGTATQTSNDEIRVYDFSLGICNENKIFKIPEICEEAKRVHKWRAHNIRRISPTIAYVSRNTASRRHAHQHNKENTSV